MQKLVQKIKHRHHDNLSVWFIPPCTPLLYSKTGVYRGIHYFLIFPLKHRLWVLARTASVRGGSNVYPQSMFWAKNKKNINFFIRQFSFLQPWSIAVYYMGVLTVYRWHVKLTIIHQGLCLGEKLVPCSHNSEMRTWTRNSRENQRSHSSHG